MKIFQFEFIAIGDTSSETSALNADSKSDIKKKHITLFTSFLDQATKQLVPDVNNAANSLD